MFSISGTRQVFSKLKQMFLEVLILNYFDLKPYIYVETNVFGYVICGIFSQLNFDNLDQWHLVAFFSHKIIFVETYYKTYNNQLLAII